MIDLEGYRVLVTGGSRGIGAACCRLFARAGAAVWVHYHQNQVAAEAVVEECRAENDQSHCASAADLAKRDDVNRLFDTLESRWGALDCLVNNAGVWLHNPIAGLDAELFEATWRLNVEGVFECTRRAVPWLSRSGHGSIVSISSTAGQRGEAEYSPYAASKGALIAATKSWSSELAPRVRANSVAPGWVDTEMSAATYAGGGLERIERTIPLRRVASAEDIAGAVLFLASPLARHITGEILNVNGGSVLAG